MTPSSKKTTLQLVGFAGILFAAAFVLIVIWGVREHSYLSNRPRGPSGPIPMLSGIGGLAKDFVKMCIVGSVVGGAACAITGWLCFRAASRIPSRDTLPHR